MKLNSFFALIFLLTSLSCQRGNVNHTTEKTNHADKIEKQEAAGIDSYFSKNEHLVLGTLYHQQSAEYKALCYQAYNIGRLMLDKDLSDNTIDKHRVVVLDIDETVLNNTPYEAACILQDINYPTRWEEWCNKAIAEPIPGCLEFLNYARANGVSVFYVTNRKDFLKKATILNLQKLKFPQADEEHVIARTTEDSKEGRRKMLEEKYHISLLFGDNLSDFSYVFDVKSNETRIKEADRLYKEFGSRFIVLPNSTYGDWEVNLYRNQKDLTDSAKTMIRHKALTGF